MSNPLLAVSDYGTHSPKQGGVFLAEEVGALQTRGMKNVQSRVEMQIEKPTIIELSARDLLAPLSKMRISAGEIICTGDGFQAGGTYANVSVATLMRTRRKAGKGRQVAVKKFRFAINGDFTGEKLLRLFANELRVLNKLSHRRIVKILGFVEDAQNCIAWLVFPWEENGNLRQFLRSEEWEIPERVLLIHDVASGLKYLHNHHPPICHGDLKSLNILVNSSNRAIITDFGSARILQQPQELNTRAATPAASAGPIPPKRNELPQLRVNASKTVLTLTGPAYSLRWAPPEVLNGEAPDLASDIWALGWIAWETLTGNYPFEELDSEFDVTMRILQGRLPSIYDHDQLSQIYSLCSLMQRCWDPEPKERPTATECKRVTRQIPHVVPVTRGSTDSESKRRSATLFSKMGELHRLKHRHEEASEMYKQALAIARSIGDEKAEVTILGQVANNARGQFKYLKAEAFYSQAFLISRRIGSPSGLAMALDGLGLIQQAQSSYVEAEQLFRVSLSIYKLTGNKHGQANALQGSGHIQLAQSKYAEAEAFFCQALAIYETNPSDLGRGNALQGLGHVQRARCKYPEAEKLYSQALVIYERIGDSLGQAHTLDRLADVQLALDKSAEAEASLIKATDIFARFQHDLDRARSSIRLSEIWLRQARFVEVKALLAEVVTLSEQIDDARAWRSSMKLLKAVKKAEKSSAQSTA